MKIILYIGILTLMILIVFLLFSGISENGEQSEPTTNNFPSNIPQNDFQAETVQLKSTGGFIIARNFLQDARTYADPINEGYYQLGYYIDPSSPMPAEIPFSIEFTSQTQHFIVSLQQENLVDARFQAENFLLEHLDISEQELCTLSYMVSVPNRINSVYAGQDLRFSFCSDAISL